MEPAYKGKYDGGRVYELLARAGAPLRSALLVYAEIGRVVRVNLNDENP
jgi:hypothetical protein